MDDRYDRIWMRSALKWRARLSTQNIAVYATCILPNSNQVIASCGEYIFFLDLETGQIQDSRVAHQATLYCIRCSYDGIYFASAGANGLVVIYRTATKEAIVSYGSVSSVKQLEWCPTRTLLVSCTKNEMNIWRKNEVRTTRVQVQDDIISLAFAPSGDSFAVSFGTGKLIIYSIDDYTALQTMTFSSIVTKVAMFDKGNRELLLACEADKRISMFKTADGTLVGRNTLHIAPLALCTLEDSYILFGGVSNHMDLLTSTLQYLGGFDIESDWVWDLDSDNKGRIVVATKEGFLEMRQLEFEVSGGCYENTLVYRNGLNCVRIENLREMKGQQLNMPRIIHEVAIEKNIMAIMYERSLEVYMLDDLCKCFEMQSNFAGTRIAVSSSKLFWSKKKELQLYDLTGKMITKYEFSTDICSLSSSSKGKIVACCSDGAIYLCDDSNTVLLLIHDSRVISAVLDNLDLVFIDENGSLIVYNRLEKRVRYKHEGRFNSVACSDRVEGLISYSDGEKLYVKFRDYQPMTMAMDGSVLGFHQDRVYICSKGGLESVVAPLPIDLMLEKGDFECMRDLLTMGLDDDTCQRIVKEALKRKQLSIAYEFVRGDDPLAFFVNAIAPSSGRQWDDDLRMALGEAPIREAQTKTDEMDEGSLVKFISEGNWKKALKIAKEKHLERMLIDMDIQDEASDAVAKALLSAGLNEGAIKVLTRSNNITTLAKAHVYLGNWIEAISLSRLYSTVYDVIYPRFGQLLFEGGDYFESLVCIFISRNKETRESTIERLFEHSSQSFNCEQLSYCELLRGFAHPDDYWHHHTMSVAYAAARRLKGYLMLPLTEDDAQTVFQLCFFLLAVLFKHEMKGVRLSDIYLQFLVSASLLNMKRWVAFALKELTQFDLDEPTRQVARRVVRLQQEKTDAEKLHFSCPRCHREFWHSMKFPSLACGYCSTRIAFTGYSCTPLPAILCNHDLEETELLDLIGNEHAVEDVACPIVPTRDFFLKAPPEDFIIQSLKKQAHVSPQVWFCSEMLNFRVCCNCGVILDSADFQDSAMKNECCPLCRTTKIDPVDMGMEIQSEVLELLRSFEANSPVVF